MPRTVSQRDLAPRVDRFVDRVDDLDRLAALQAVDERGALTADRADHVLDERLVAETVDVVGHRARFLDDRFVLGRLIFELPGNELVDGKAPDHDSAVLTQYA